MSLHHLTANSQLVSSLIESPLTGEELPVTSGSITPTQRQIVARLTVPPKGNSKSVGYGKPLVVYYLYGDERRAVRKFIESNEQWVSEVMEPDYNRLKEHWDDIMYQILEEEWSFHQRGDVE